MSGTTRGRHNKSWQKWGILAALALVLAVGFFVFVFPPGEMLSSSEDADYFDKNAPVMYFYTDTCHYCVEQKPILQELAAEGMKVKPMNVGLHRRYITQWGITGTPMFIAPNGDSLYGFQDKESLRAFLEAHA